MNDPRRIPTAGPPRPSPDEVRTRPAAGAGRRVLEYARPHPPVGPHRPAAARFVAAATFALVGLAYAGCSGAGFVGFALATVGRARDDRADPLATAMCGIGAIAFALTAGYWAKETWLGVSERLADADPPDRMPPADRP